MGYKGVEQQRDEAIKMAEEYFQSKGVNVYLWEVVLPQELENSLTELERKILGTVKIILKVMSPEENANKDYSEVINLSYLKTLTDWAKEQEAQNR